MACLTCFGVFPECFPKEGTDLSYSFVGLFFSFLSMLFLTRDIVFPFCVQWFYSTLHARILVATPAGTQAD